MHKHPKCTTFTDLDVLLDKVQSTVYNGFDQIVENANINKQENKEWATNYYQLVNDNSKLQKKIKRLKVWRWILIIFLIFPFFLLNSKAKKLEKVLEEKENVAKNIKQKLDNQLLKVVNEIDSKLTLINILNSSWEDIKLKKAVDNKLCNWEEDFENYMGNNACATDLLSGFLFEHPFAIFNKKEQVWIQQAYSGSVSLPYTETRNGQTYSGVDVVTATVTRPAPVWNYDTKLIYKTSTPDKLSFTNSVSKAEFKKWNKKNQLPLENKEFNKVCKIIRNSEQQIRVVFTPLAQENFVNLLKEKDYWITKDGNYTIIDFPKNDLVLNTNLFNAFNYDLDVWKDQLSQYLKHVAKCIGSFSLPIANLPIYYQISYKESFPSLEYSILEIQNNMNLFMTQFGLDKSFNTDVIYSPISVDDFKIGKTNYLVSEISCNFFTTKHKTIIVPTMSAHHGMVSVPVEVVEYFPASEKMFLANTVNLSSNNNGLFKNFLIDNGELVVVYNKKFDKENFEKIIKNFIKKED